MEILVQKYGGTSTATSESRENIYGKIEQAKAAGKAVVVVISAMGRKGAPYATDTLLGLVKEENSEVSKRELDMIFACGEIISGTLITAQLQKRGHKAVYLTGGQAGIVTDGNYTDAKIVTVNTKRILGLLEAGTIVVVAGGQGATAEGEITSLGRGGSDTTGCALGVALGAGAVEIYTDVEGIMTADPRKVKDARLLTVISHEDCIHLANNGAKVMHPRSVETAAENKSMKLYVKSTFSDYIGTLIGEAPSGAEKKESYLVGVSSGEKGDHAVVSLIGHGLSKEKGLPNKIQEILAKSKIVPLTMEQNDVAIAVEVQKEEEGATLAALHTLLA